MYMSLINKYLNFWMVCTSKQWSYALGFTSRYRNLKISNQVWNPKTWFSEIFPLEVPQQILSRSGRPRQPGEFLNQLRSIWPKKTPRRSADRRPLLIDWLLINWWSHQTQLLMFLFPFVAPKTLRSFPRALCRQLLVRFEYKVENYSFFALLLL